MKTTAFLIFSAGVLISLDGRVLASGRGGKEESWKGEDVKEEIPPPRPSFPVFMLPSFSLPTLNLPYLQALSLSNRRSAERIRATKTEYVEVTRRQTVHPICYTAYEAKTPCLPYGQTSFLEDDYENIEFDAVHQANENFQLNEVRKSIQVTPSFTVTPTQVPDADKRNSGREAKYLEFKMRKNAEPLVKSSKAEGSQFFHTAFRFPPQVQATEYQTKTILITKLEKYTDRRVTATLLAVNCLPVDRGIPMCQTYPAPIREAPDRRSDIDYLEVDQMTVLSNDTKAVDEIEPTGTTTEEAQPAIDYSQSFLLV